MRRLLMLSLMLALAAFVPVTSAGAVDPAPAPAPCSISVPAQVSATAPYTAVYPSFANCANTSYTWEVKNGKTVYGTFKIVDGTSKGAWRFRDNYPTGTYAVVPSAASAAGGTVSNTAPMVVKFGSRISLSAKRVSDLKVPLTGIVSRYVPSVNAFRRWANRPIAISYRNCTDCPWKFLAMDKTDKYGKYSLGAVSYQKRYYRAKVGETETTWSRTSVPVFD